MIVTPRRSESEVDALDCASVRECPPSLKMTGAHTCLMVRFALAILMLAGCLLLRAAALGAESLRPGCPAHGLIVLGFPPHQPRHTKPFPTGWGWGTCKPTTLYVGDPTSTIASIHWTSWGGSVARGYGVTHLAHPGGGIYRQGVRVLLRASRIGQCFDRKVRAYTTLEVRVPTRIGGPLSRWEGWLGGDACR
jgi:hypothetical protein